jgi:hypothetical protein
MGASSKLISINSQQLKAGCGVENQKAIAAFSLPRKNG